MTIDDAIEGIPQMLYIQLLAKGLYIGDVINGALVELFLKAHALLGTGEGDAIGFIFDRMDWWQAKALFLMTKELT